MLPFHLRTALVICALAAVTHPALCQEQESTFFSTVWVDDALTVATGSAGHSGRLNVGLVSGSEDDWDREDKPESWWGYAWPRLYTMDTLVVASGSGSDEGGWYREPQRVSPEYPGSRHGLKSMSAQCTKSAPRTEKPSLRSGLRAVLCH